MIYLTGDCHGQFKRIKEFCERQKTTKDDILIILGDAGFNYNGDRNDLHRKRYARNLPITLFCIHGNHEMRPEKVPHYYLSDWHGGKVWIENEFPNLRFARDGEIYDLDGQQTIVIGGAYSVDKDYRLNMGYPWFSDEQPSPEIKAFVEQQLDARHWHIDNVLSHTVPLKYMPVDAFLPTVDQSEVDRSTEEWLDSIEERLTYRHWYAGHYHIDRKIDNIQIMFQDFDVLDCHF